MFASTGTYAGQGWASYGRESKVGPFLQDLTQQGNGTGVGAKHGEGVYMSSAGTVVFRGQFQNDKMDGEAHAFSSGLCFRSLGFYLYAQEMKLPYLKWLMVG